MRRELIKLPGFLRSVRRLFKKFPDLDSDLTDTLEALSKDAFAPTLGTHKLKGDLAGFLACSAGYDLRIVFRFGNRDGKEVIFLEAIGKHDDVY